MSGDMNIMKEDKEEGSHSSHPHSFIFHSADPIWIFWKECLCLPYHALFWGITWALTPQWRWLGSLSPPFKKRCTTIIIFIHFPPEEKKGGGGDHFVRLYNPFKFMDVCTADLSDGNDTEVFWCNIYIWNKHTHEINVAIRNRSVKIYNRHTLNSFCLLIRVRGTPAHCLGF